MGSSWVLIMEEDMKCPFLISAGKVTNYFATFITNINDILGSFLHIFVIIQYYLKLLIWRKGHEVFWLGKTVQPCSPLICICFILEQEVELGLGFLTWVVLNWTYSCFSSKSGPGIAPTFNFNFQAVLP